jgi:hypothetical protein
MPMTRKLPAAVKLSERIVILVTKEKKRDLEGKARDAGVSFGEYVRRKLDDEPLPEKKRR